MRVEGPEQRQAALKLAQRRGAQELLQRSGHATQPGWVLSGGVRGCCEEAEEGEPGAVRGRGGAPRAAHQRARPGGQVGGAPALRQLRAGGEERGEGHLGRSPVLPGLRPAQQQLHPRQRSLERTVGGQRENARADGLQLLQQRVLRPLAQQLAQAAAHCSHGRLRSRKASAASGGRRESMQASRAGAARSLGKFEVMEVTTEVSAEIFVHGSALQPSGARAQQEQQWDQVYWQD